MTVAELLQELETFDPETEVCVVLEQSRVNLAYDVREVAIDDDADNPEGTAWLRLSGERYGAPKFCW